MKTFDIVRRAGRSLKHAKARTILTSLAIAVGAFTLTLAIAAGEGARQYANTLLTTNIDPQILAIAKDKSFFEGGQTGPQEYDPNASLLMRATGRTVIKQLTQDDIDAIAARADIVSINPAYTINAQYMTRPGQKKYTADVTQYDSGVTQTVAAGSLPALRTSIADGEIALPEAYVSLLGFKYAQDAIGATVTIHFERTPTPTQAQIQAALTQGAAAIQQLGAPQPKDVQFKVVAIVGKSATALTAMSNVQVSNVQAKELSEFSTEGTSSYHKYSIATASVKQGVDPASVKQALVAKGYGVQTAKDLQGLLFTIVNILQGIVIGFGVLALITSVFGIVNTQYISVLERTREIGLMKALGMRGRHVSRLFQFEAAWIGFLGGTIGAVIAVATGLALNPWITRQLTLGDGNYLLIFQPIPIIFLVIVLMAIAMLAGYFPARKASKLDPIEALRTE
ncbi:ABC transporter permease [Candidatus Saccharibacteria bacterium]|nr:ABC transporter permease [Candidatus Saccharibacteria bacterium]